MEQIFLSKIQLTNFRNLDESIFEFSEGINCIFGQNGNGKTNILESIYFLINRKSFRKNTSFQQLINVECEEPRILISSVFKDNNDNAYSYSGEILNEQSLWYKNNQKTTLKPDLNCIFLNPFDSFSFHNTASFRRQWIDTHLAMIDSNYKKTLSKYNASLKFRNNLLAKKPFHFKEQIRANDIQFSKLSYELVNNRLKFIREMEDYCGKTFKIIFNEVHNLKIDLKSKFSNYNQEQIYETYQATLEKDCIIGHTKDGVHRDDYIFNFDGFNSYEFCSLGQQKMSFLSLIFAYIELFRYKFNSYPIVLIDDVSGELDECRWKNLIGYLQAKNFQVLITTANENFKKELERIENAKKIIVKDGKNSILPKSQ